MHTIRFRGCVAQQDNKTFDIFVSKPGYPDKKYNSDEKLSGKELRTVVMRYLNEIVD